MWRGVVSRRLLLRVIPLWLFCVATGSFLPGKTKLAIGTTTPARAASRVETVGIIHRCLHVAAFGATAMLLIFAAPNRRREVTGALCALAFGTLIETIQPLVFGNVFEWWDVRDDAFGVLAALAVARLTHAREVLVRDAAPEAGSKQAITHES